MATRTSASERVTLQSPSTEWVHLSRNLPQDVAYLDRRFHFHPVDLRETLPPIQRHKLVVREDYIFMILLFPVFDKKTKIVTTSEVDFFIGPNLIVTVNDGTLPFLSVLFKEFNRDRTLFHEATEHGPSDLLYNIIDGVLEHLFPMLLHLSTDIDVIEKDLFDANQRRVITEILRIKTNIVNVRKAIHGHKKTVEALLRAPANLIHIQPVHAEYEDLINRTKEIWDTVELHRDTINALHETHASLMEAQTNHTMKTLTSFSVIIFPLTLLAGLFAADVGGNPFHADPTGFWKILIFLFGLGILMWVYFKQKKWM